MTNRARAYIGLVTGAGALALIPASLMGAGWVRSHALEFLGLAALVVLAERFVIHLPLRRETLSFSVVETVATFALITIPEAPFVLAMSAGVLTAQIIRRRPWVKAGFNTAMYSICSAAAALTFSALSETWLQGPFDWGAAIAAMAVFYILNQSLVSLVIAFVEGQRMQTVLRVSLPLMGLTGGGNVSLGLIAAYLAGNPWALALLVIPFALAFAAYTAWIRSRRESEKMHSLYTTGTTLVAQLESNDQAIRFLEACRDMFRAQSAYLVISTEGGLQVVNAEGESSNHPDLRVSAYLDSNHSSSQLIAMLPPASGIPGALVVQDHRGPEGPAPFPSEDVPLLQALANEAAVVLNNLALFRSVAEERAKLRDIVENTSDGIYQVAPDRRIITWNPAMEKITGFSASEAIGQMCFNILRARDGRGVDLCSTDCPILEACETGKTQDRDAEIMTRDGTARWIHYTHSPIRDPSGLVTSDVIVVRDMTADRAVQQAKEDFVGTVSHELRTPLTPIKGFLLTLMRGDQNFSEEERRDFHQRMLRQTERLESLVADLLEVSRLESGRLDMDVVAVDMSTLVERVVADFRHSNPGRDFRVTLLPTATARADESRVDQILSNLLQNAVRYSPATTPVDVRVEQDPTGTEVYLTVRDQGPGIPYEDQERIFERFYRLGDHLTRQQGGTGLGLYISRRLAEEMDGRISLHSRLGNGSAFTIHLPATNGRRPENAGRLVLEDEPAPEQADRHR